MSHFIHLAGTETAAPKRRHRNGGTETAAPKCHVPNIYVYVVSVEYYSL